MSVGSLLIVQITAFIIGWAGPWRDPPERHSNGRVFWPIRMGLSFSMVLGAFLVWLGAPARSPAAAYAVFTLFGMIASFIGDLIMARLIPAPNRLIGGKTFAPESLSDTLRIPISTDSVLAAVKGGKHLRVGFKLVSSRSADIRIATALAGTPVSSPE